MPRGNSGHTWGFIGLGNMGGPMVLNLRSNVPDADIVIVYDKNTEAAQRVAEKAKKKIDIAPDLAMISQLADTIITCLPNPTVARVVFTTLVNQPKELRPERLVIDCSTIDTATSVEMKSMVQKAGLGIFIDAPMSGGVVGAQAGTLSFMVGCTPGIFSSGTGISAKLANNYLLAINNLATAEAMNFGIKAGLNPVTLAEIINSATGQNWASEKNNPVPGVTPNAPSSREYQGGFAVTLMNKDLKLAVAAAEQLGAPLLLSKAASGIYGNLAHDMAYAGLDFSSVYKYLMQSRKAKL